MEITLFDRKINLDLTVSSRRSNMVVTLSDMISVVKVALLQRSS